MKIKSKCGNGLAVEACFQELQEAAEKMQEAIYQMSLYDIDELSGGYSIV